MAQMCCIIGRLGYAQAPALGEWPQNEQSPLAITHERTIYEINHQHP